MLHTFSVPTVTLCCVGICGFNVSVTVGVTKCAMTHIECVWYNVWNNIMETLSIINGLYVAFHLHSNTIRHKVGHTYYHIRHFIYMVSFGWFYKYRLSHNTVDTLFFWMFRLLLHLGLKIWTFLWSPFNSDFKIVLILIPSIKIDQITTMNRKKW